jgi:hypothetical protein
MSASEVLIIVFVTLINYYLVDDPVFYEKSGQVLVNDSIRLSGESVSDFPITAVLVDECRDQLALRVDATTMLTPR